MSELLKCRICNSGNPKNKLFNAYEFMNETLEEFQYFSCSECEAAQIKEYPSNLSDYYKNYYSFFEYKKSGMRRLLITMRDKHGAGLFTIIGWMLSKIRPDNQFNYVKFTGMNRSKKVLDVGSGAGEIAYRLYDIGFKDILSIDPFLSKEMGAIECPGPRFLKADIYSVTGEYDLILFNHSLEHIPNQLKVLHAAMNLLKDDGFIVVRVPVFNSLAWKIFGEAWCQLDAPRHLYLHTLKSITTLAQSSGLKLVKFYDDSTEYQLSGSVKNSILIGKIMPLFLKRELKTLVNYIKRSNMGDQYCYILSKNK